MDRAALETLIARHGVTGLLSRGVLLVDDDASNLVVLQSFLESDYTVHLAQSGDEALALAERVDLDVVVTDQRMPGRTGVELLERLRAMRPDVAGIVITAYADTPALVSAINQAQVFRYLRKPWNPDELFASVADASEKVYQQRAIQRLVKLLGARTDELAATVERLHATRREMLHLERVATMGRLAAGVTHDLQNALQALVLVEEQLKDRDDGDELALNLEIGLEGIRNLSHTLASLNQYARSGRLEVALQLLDPGDVVRDAVRIAKMEPAMRERQLVLRIAEELPIVFGDRHKLIQLLVNLLRNAMQATGPGQYIGIDVNRFGTTGVLLGVEDDGPGIPAARRAGLFEPFESTKGEHGMGMGLYMARLIVESHDGRIGLADTTAAQGTRMEIWLPVARAV